MTKEISKCQIIDVDDRWDTRDSPKKLKWLKNTKIWIGSWKKTTEHEYWSIYFSNGFILKRHLETWNSAQGKLKKETKTSRKLPSFTLIGFSEMFMSYEESCWHDTSRTE